VANTDMVDLPPWLAGGSAAQLFVHGQVHAERALVLARPQDVVCVPDEVDPAYLGFLAGLGLGPRPGRVIAASRFGPTASPDRALWARLAGSADALRALAELLQGGGGASLHPYAASGGERALAAAIEVAADADVRVAAPDPALAAYADQKHHIRAKAIELGIPVAAGEVVILPRAGGRRRRDYDALRTAVDVHLRHTGQAIVRGAMGASGASTFVVGGRGEDTDGLLRRLSLREDNHVYLVESLVTGTVSPHVQLHVAPGGGPITCVGVTDQRWERPLVHGGNVYPTSGRHVDAMLDWAGWPAGSRARATPDCSGSTSWSTSIPRRAIRPRCSPRYTRGWTGPHIRSRSCSGSTPRSARPAHPRAPRSSRERSSSGRPASAPSAAPPSGSSTRPGRGAGWCRTR
jgi:hypothetical protein